MKISQIIVRPFVVLVERYYPDPFVFAIILTFVTIFLSLGLTDAGLQQTILAWGNGLSSLFA
ncbi:MAG: TIGR00366 family protein, partial [Nitrospinaceae bacterium]